MYRRHEDLVAELRNQRQYPGPVDDALVEVNRARFIPPRMWRPMGGGEWRAVDQNEDPKSWYDAVYTDAPIVTQYDDGRTKWPEVGRIGSVSSSRPSTVLAMLHALSAQPGEAVLHLGMGVGVTTAYLAHIVGTGGQVTAIEWDDRVRMTAQEHLIRAGFVQARTLNRNAMGGTPTHTHKRLLATMSVLEVPHAWVRQLRPGGVIVAPLRTELAYGPVVRLEVLDNGAAHGYALDLPCGFSPSRTQRLPDFDPADTWWLAESDTDPFPSIDPGEILDNPVARWAVANSINPCRAVQLDGVWWIRDAETKSWASVTLEGGRWVVCQGGERKLWSEITHAYVGWCRRGEPGLSSWEVTVTPRGQTVRLAA